MMEWLAATLQWFESVKVADTADASAALVAVPKPLEVEEAGIQRVPDSAGWEDTQKSEEDCSGEIPCQMISQLQHLREQRIWFRTLLTDQQEKRQALEEKLDTVMQENEGLKAQLEAAEEKARIATEESERLEAQLEASWEKLRIERAENEWLDAQLETSEEDARIALEQNERLERQLWVRKAACGFGFRAFWQYQMDNCWETFPPDANEKTLQAYMEYLQGKLFSPLATITSGGTDREVDFELMEQRQLRTNKVRRIRLFTTVPPHWTAAPADLLQQGNNLRSFYKKVWDQQIWVSIRKILQNTGHSWDRSKDCCCMSRAQIKSVYRIENFCLWHRYKARLAAMRQDHVRFNVSVGSAELDLDGYGNIMGGSQKMFDCGEPLEIDVDEKILLHGTSWDKANCIVREGFDHRTCQRALYGAGVYFASSACKSHQYTCEQHSKCCQCKCERTLIIARVALGDVYVALETREKERRPPLRGSTSGTFDSIAVFPGPVQGHHHTNQIHQEHVIFERDQAYPCYVVQYTV